MKLPKPFYRLPIRLDVERMRAEVQALDSNAWVRHPNEIKGNSSVRLISAGGGENDDVAGEMLPTPHLEQSPYLRQILASFGVVWSRSRLMRLAPGCGVPQHADINHHWFFRVRLHMPVITRPEVRFHCGNETVHMAAGEVWLFDNWRLHEVENPTAFERIHFVADTSGSAAFWQFVASADAGNVPVQDLRFDPARIAAPLTERTEPPVVMPPAELELIAFDLVGEIDAAPSAQSAVRVGRYRQLLENLCRDWRQLYALHGEQQSGWPEFQKLVESVRAASAQMGDQLVARTNRIAIHQVCEGRILRHLLHLPQTLQKPKRKDSPTGEFDRPIFIVAAPRSGSTMLFEALASNSNLVTLGGEAHWLVESIQQLQPGAEVESNRLGAEQAIESVRKEILRQIDGELRDSAGKRIPPMIKLRLLEKTPKNALRVPFFNRIFPDALFVFLWRDPRENLSSIIEAWRSGQWKTYNGLKGFDGPWSLLLPPGWRTMNGKSLEEIAAFQWDSTNRIVLDDLALLPKERWTTVNYADLVAEPAATLQRVCAFAGLEVDAALRSRWSAPLPHSKFTHTPPEPGKWRRNEALIERVMPNIQFTWQRLKALS
jgi:hypothetical protein